MPNHEEAPGDGLAAEIGSVLRRRRQLAGLTQAELAGRVDSSQPTIARIERGKRAPSIPMLERLLAALGTRGRLELEPLDQQVGDVVEPLAQVPIGARIVSTGIAALAADLAPVRFVLAGAAAALLQGAPVPVAALEVALCWRDGDRFADWLAQRGAARWDEQQQRFGGVPLDPREPGEHRWFVAGRVLDGHFDAELPAQLVVRHGGRDYPVVPLVDVELADPAAAYALARYQVRSATKQYETVPFQNWRT